ncbi:DASH complex subunit Dam1-domain-containing protein [Bombardia bombarda]|uniref:DASH complex subunit DAM1 n=1 Tax=Bombardia bombarda TaxID=252184 RepID=A0AA39X216_9PEZI|nr:DASH complex subunit Dam1-domain-containing protein [Bombardia bombarda]
MAGEDAKQQQRGRSTSRTRNSRPTTPLRPSSRSSFRESARDSVHGAAASFPLNAFEPAFAELSDAMADLEANMMHFQLMHESLARFSESFASFMYGLNMNAFCVDFPEGPMSESFRRMKQQDAQNGGGGSGSRYQDNQQPTREVENNETTFMTTDTSFIENPSTASKATPKKFQTPTPATRQSRVAAPPATRGGGASRGGRGDPAAAGRGTRPSRLAKPRGGRVK